MTAKSEPGILLKIYGALIKIAKDTPPTMTASILIVEKLLITASNFSTVSIGFTPFG